MVEINLKVMIYLLLIIINSIFLFSFNQIEKKINVFDYPSEKKIHSQKVSLLGGLIFLINIIIYLIYIFFFETKSFLNIFGFSSIISNAIFLLSIFLLFLIGFIDDKKNLSAKVRILLLIFVIIINLFYIPQINISIIKLSFFDTFSIYSYSFFWTLVCFLLFINAFNFFDGINLQTSGLIFVICIFFLLKKIYFEFFLVILIANIFFSFLNYKSKTFLGNSGSFFLPFLFGGLFISAYNNNINITSDEIVIIMLIPGMDLIRLFFQRLVNKSSPFTGDKEHIHHYMIKKHTPLMSALLIQILIWVPFLIFQILGNFYLSFTIQVLAYILIIIKYKN